MRPVISQQQNSNSIKLPILATKQTKKLVRNSNTRKNIEFLLHTHQTHKMLIDNKLRTKLLTLCKCTLSLHIEFTKKSNTFSISILNNRKNQCNYSYCFS